MAIRKSPESEWKIFRKLREVALQRFCERILAEAVELATGNRGSAHERYLQLYRLIHKRDEEMGWAFNDPRRSQMIQQLAAIHSLGLLKPEEMERFTPKTCETIRVLSGQS